MHMNRYFQVQPIAPIRNCQALGVILTVACSTRGTEGGMLRFDSAPSAWITPFRRASDSRRVQAVERAVRSSVGGEALYTPTPAIQMGDSPSLPILADGHKHRMSASHLTLGLILYAFPYCRGIMAPRLLSARVKIGADRNAHMAETTDERGGGSGGGK